VGGRGEGWEEEEEEEEEDEEEEGLFKANAMNWEVDSERDCATQVEEGEVRRRRRRRRRKVYSGGGRFIGGGGS
jgi:hypothetical protein